MREIKCGPVKENWYNIPGTNGLYDVDEFGCIRSFARGIPRILSSKHGSGYLQVGLCINGVRVYRQIHQIVAEVFLGPCPPGMEINHIDGDKYNNHWTNLEYVTSSENKLHAFRVGLRNQDGENHPRARLSTYGIKDIISRYNGGGVTQNELADEYGVRQQTISSIITRTRWGHVEI